MWKYNHISQDFNDGFQNMKRRKKKKKKEEKVKFKKKMKNKKKEKKTKEKKMGLQLIRAQTYIYSWSSLLHKEK